MTSKKPEPSDPHAVGARIGHARRLLGVRIERDMAVPDLAKLIGVSAESVYNWEAGIRPAKRNLARLEDVLGVAEPWILYGLGEGPTAAPTEKDRALAEAISAAEALAAEAEPTLRTHDVKATRQRQAAKRGDGKRAAAAGDRRGRGRPPKPR